jgi:peptidoglycan/LPS O-acetylase OafA/YrhL
VNCTMYCLARWIFPTAFMSLILVSTFGYQSKAFINTRFNCKTNPFFYCVDMLTRFFTAKVFVHISKLEYAIYLLNPLVIIVLCGLSKSSRLSEPVMALNLVLAVAVLTYMLAVLFSVLFELPFSKLLSEFFKKKENCLETKSANIMT